MAASATEVASTARPNEPPRTPRQPPDQPNQLPTPPTRQRQSPRHHRPTDEPTHQTNRNPKRHISWFRKRNQERGQTAVIASVGVSQRRTDRLPSSEEDLVRGSSES